MKINLHTFADISRTVSIILSTNISMYSKQSDSPGNNHWYSRECRDRQWPGSNLPASPEAIILDSFLRRNDAPLVTTLREFQETARGPRLELLRLPKFDPSSSCTPPDFVVAGRFSPPQIRLFNLIFANRADLLASVSNPGRRASSQGS